MLLLLLRELRKKLLRKQLSPLFKLRHLPKLWMTLLCVVSLLTLQALVSWIRLVKRPMQLWLMKLIQSFQILRPSSLQLPVKPLLEIRVNMVLLYIPQVLASLLSTMHNLLPSLMIKFRI
ncbi:hypothetical protein AAZX31_08G258300 [Glycine max]